MVVSNRQLYWTDSLTINTASASGGAARFLARRAFAYGLIYYGFGIAVDAQNIYWVDGGTEAAAPGTPPPGKECRPPSTPPCVWDNDDGAVIRMPRNGGKPVPLACGLKMPIGPAVDADFVYWADSGGAGGKGRLMRTEVAGGEPTLLADDVRIDGNRLIVAGAAVYWWDRSEGIMKVAASGGAGTPVVQGKIVPGFEVTGDSVYFWELTATDGGRPTRAVLVRRPLAGGPPITIATSDDTNALASNQVSFVVDGDGVYWSAGDKISKTSTDGRRTTTIASGRREDIELVAADATSLYYLADQSLFAIPK